MKLLQNNWIMWALLFVVVVTLFGPSAVAYAGTPHTPAYTSVLQDLTVACANAAGHRF